MASLGGLGGSEELDISRMSDSEKREFQQFVQNESQKAGIQESIHALTAMCFKKCITGTIKQGALDRNEEGCVQNCVGRFMDSNMLTLRHLEKMRTQG